MSTLQMILCKVVWLIALFSSNALIANDLRYEISSAWQGEQLVRFSVAAPPNFLTADTRELAVKSDEETISAGVRILSWHPQELNGQRSVGRFIITFPAQFKAGVTRQFSMCSPDSQTQELKLPEKMPLPISIQQDGAGFRLIRQGHDDIRLEPRIPVAIGDNLIREVIEENHHYQWIRFHSQDANWPSIAEFRLTCTGELTAVIHLQRCADGDGFAPEIGWIVSELTSQPRLRSTGSADAYDDNHLTHSFREGRNVECLLDQGLKIEHPIAPHKRAGSLKISQSSNNSWRYEYCRCHAHEQVPMQSWAWQQAELVIAPEDGAPLTSTLQSPLQFKLVDENQNSADVDPKTALLKNLPDSLHQLIQYHRHAVVKCAAVGADNGNINGFQDGAEHGGVFGMNRLNHCAAIFEDARRSGDRQLREAALRWCDNFHDLSIWWGQPRRGGTRYNNLTGINQQPPTTDFMWRSNGSVHFCTKGYDAFRLAWQETGDPRMLEACEAQVRYAAEHLHADRGECRNIGDVRDFVRLYRDTGEQRFLEEALRLFRELRTKLSIDYLFDQGGKPIDPNPPFIDDDARGLKIGYAKPYIIGYALSGLPELLELTPDEPGLRETVRAVANFLASTVDPAGGWRYPHSHSGRVLISFGPEPAWQLAQAARVLGPEPEWMDAIELVLRARLHGFLHTGTILSGLEPWEVSSGKIGPDQSLHDLYQKPSDRDRDRDYDLGRISLGSSPPEGLVYLPEVLTYYLQHRPVQRLLRAPEPTEPLARILARVAKKESQP